MASTTPLEPRPLVVPTTTVLILESVVSLVVVVKSV